MAFYNVSHVHDVHAGLQIRGYFTPEKIQHDLPGRCGLNVPRAHRQSWINDYHRHDTGSEGQGLLLG